MPVDNEKGENMGKKMGCGNNTIKNSITREMAQKYKNARINTLTGAGARGLAGSGEALHGLTGAGHSTHSQPRHHRVLQSSVVGETQRIVQSWLGGGDGGGGAGCGTATTC